MTTSLADQLRRFSKPQTSNLERGKERASLLFDPKEAAGIEKQSIYELGSAGLVDLICKNESFKSFAKTLFSLESKDFERSVELSSTNAKLDREIKKFLLLLSPYFITDCSFKALEWLIYRYSIHQYNREAFLMLVMPYYSTEPFQKVIALMKFEEVNDPWAFLKNIQKAGTFLTNQQLYNHAASNPYFIQFVSDFILNIIKIHDNPKSLIVAFNFYFGVLYGALEYSKGTPEAIITQMLPALLKGLNSPLLDFRAASYMIASGLITKFSCTDAILNKFMQKLSSNPATHLIMEEVLFYCILYQRQSHYKSIPDEALAELISKERFVSTLQELNATGTYIYPFLEVLIKKIVIDGLDVDNAHYRTFLIDLLDQLNIEETGSREENVASVLNTILDSVTTKPKDPEVGIWIKKVIEKLETQYPISFDKQVNQILTLPENESRKRRLKKILSKSAELWKKFEAFSTLYDANAVKRKDAIKFILQNYDCLRDEEKDVLKVFVEHRLKDNCLDVVKEALRIIKKTKILNLVKVNELLCELLLKCYKDKYSRGKISSKILKLLCVAENSSNFSIITIIFPILLPKPKTKENQSSEDIAMAKLVIDSPWFQNCPLFKDFDKKVDFNTPGNFLNELFRCLKANRNFKLIVDLFNATDSASLGKFSLIQKYTAALLVSNTVDENCSLEDIMDLLNILEKVSPNIEKNSDKDRSSILESLKLAKKGIFPLNGYLQCILNMIRCIGKIDYEKLDFMSSNVTSKFLYTVSSIFYCNGDLNRVYCDKFNETVFETDEFALDFMLHLIVYKECEQSMSQNMILDIVLAKVKCCTISEFFELEKNYIPFLLILLTSQDEETRKKVFLIGNIVLNYPSNKKSFFPLFKYLMDHQEEILLESNQLPVMFSNALSKQNDSNQVSNTLVDRYCNSDSPVYLSAGISKILSDVNDLHILEKISTLSLSILKKGSKVSSKPESEIIHNNVQRFDNINGMEIKPEHKAFEFLISALMNVNECLYVYDELISPSLLTMNYLNDSFFSSLSKKLVSIILETIIDISIAPNHPNILLKSNKIFKHIHLDVDLVIPLLKNMEEVKSENVSFNKKRKRNSISLIPTDDILDTLEWRKGERVLELIQDKKKMSNVKSLIPHLFGILKKCLSFEKQALVEYPKQLILSLILHCCHKLENEKLSECSFDMELIVQCIRISSNPQTHHHALSILTHCAPLFPTLVLHHIMAIFTFMGSCLLRHDDNYSFQLIASIIDSVIPILVQDGCTETKVAVLRVFVDVLLDVPEHRRLKLYTKLLEKIDVDENMHLFLQLVFVSHVLYGLDENVAMRKFKFEDNSKIRRLNISVEIVLQFSPSIGLNTCKKLIQTLIRLPVEKENLKKTELEIDISDLSEKQFRNFKYTILIFMNNLISTNEFISKIAKLSEEDYENLDMEDVLVGILSYIQKTHSVLNKNQNSHYWKAIQNLSLEILDCMNALQTPKMFLLVIKHLISHDLMSIRKRSLELLNSKLENNLFIEECSHEDLHSIVDSLVNIICKLNDEINEDDMIIIQKALLSLTLIIKTVGSEDQEKYVKILVFITNLIKSDKVQNYVLCSLISCLVELCVTLSKPVTVEHLPVFMPPLLKLLKRERRSDAPTLLCSSVIIAVQKIISRLKDLLSPYLKDLMLELSHLYAKWIGSIDDHFMQKLKLAKSEIENNICIRLVISTIVKSYSEIITNKKLDSIGPLMSILAESLHNTSSSEIMKKDLQNLKEFFWTALEFRNLELCEVEKTNDIENHIIGAFCNLVSKLNVNDFKQLFKDIFMWAESEGERNNRIITFYNLTHCLAIKLGYIFVKFTGIFVSNAAKILDACNKLKSPSLYFEDQTKNSLLLEKVLQTLTLVFVEKTTEKFITKDRFEILMQPLIDNLENDFSGMADLEVRNDEVLTPCIVHFAVATADDSLWKQMNYQILLKMRNSNYKIRIISLKCLTEVVKRLGEDFLPLLPETIPFLSELLEDENEIVQEHCKKSIQLLGTVLGEDLSNYF